MNSQCEIQCISPAEYEEMRATDCTAQIIDVSTPEEFCSLHVRGARNLPIGSHELEEEMIYRRGQCCEPLYVICRGGVRSAKVCRLYPWANLVSVDGGTRRWSGECLPTDCSAPAVPERRPLASVMLRLSRSLGLAT